MLRLMFITNDHKLAEVIHAAGVQRIFVDWEVLGKKERQGHLDTVQSMHTLDDLVAVRRAVPKAEILTRLNPIHPGTQNEVDAAINAGTDLLMLPMFRTVEELETLAKFVRGRVDIIPLFETPESMSLVSKIALFEDVSELYVGLNDLHMSLKMDFIFEPLAEGLLEDFATTVKQSGKRFGFGGVARVDEGDVSGSMVLGEHLRLASDSVILSRTFYRPEQEVDPQQVFVDGIHKLREEEIRLAQRSQATINEEHAHFCATILQIAQRKRQQQYA